VDSCGALMLGPRPAETIAADRIGFGQMAGYRFLNGQTPGASIWEFATERG
jgi:hypothetical protein